VTISGSAFDMDGSINRTEILVNDSLISTVKNSPFSYLMKHVEAGNYTIKIRTYDNTGAETQSDNLLITVKESTQKLPWYKFDETASGYSGADASGNNLNAVLFGGSVIAEGKTNNGLKLNGTDSYARLPITFIHLLSDFSISTWVKLDELISWVRIFDFGQGINAYMMLTADNGTGITFELKSGNNIQKLVTSQKPTVNTWSFYTVTLSDNVLSIYLNGNLIGKNTNFTLRPYDIGSSFGNYIGKSQWSTDPLLKGTIDEFRFFNRALSPDEINELMQTGTALENLSQSEIRIFPNPARNYIAIQNAEGSTATLIDPTGRLIREFSITGNSHCENINQLHSGYYILKIKDSSGREFRGKLIVN
ncbi:MAG: Beta-mannanase/endoglucanase precursor, partial [Bacteroidetes bacterium]|nr:Beta-mannanase/endoglucanase precursor [Bacteroidota bacterium]